MAARENRFDPQEFYDVLGAKRSLVAGLWMYGVLIVSFGVAMAIGGRGFQAPPEWVIPLHAIGAFAVIVSAFRAHKALGLTIPGIVAGSLLAFVIPCLMLALILSLFTRFSRYFEAWRARYGFSREMPLADYPAAAVKSADLPDSLSPRPPGR